MMGQAKRESYDKEEKKREEAREERYMRLLDVQSKEVARTLGLVKKEKNDIASLLSSIGGQILEVAYRKRLGVEPEEDVVQTINYSILNTVTLVRKTSALLPALRFLDQHIEDAMKKRINRATGNRQMTLEAKTLQYMVNATRHKEKISLKELEEALVTLPEYRG